MFPSTWFDFLTLWKTLNYPENGITLYAVMYKAIQSQPIKHIISRTSSGDQCLS